MDTVTTRILENGNLEITIPIVLRSLRGRKRVIAPDEENNGQDVILTVLARGLHWQRLIDEGRLANIKELVRFIGKDQSQIARAIRLSRLSPAIVHRIIVGDTPDGISLARLRGDLPVKWSEQEEMLVGTN